MSFATYDPTRKGAGVTLTGGNLTAAIAGLYMVAASNPQVLGSGSYYAEFTKNVGTDFWGIGISVSTSLTDSYQGAYSGQGTTWQDGSFDSGGGMTVDTTRPDFSAITGIKILVNSSGMQIGQIGVGWWDTATGTWTGDPTNGGNAIFSAIDAGSYSLGVTSISTANITANFGGSAFIDTPPAGAVGWPGAGGGTVVDLTGISATAAVGSLTGRNRAALAGNQATTATGTLVARNRAPASGIAASSALGSMAPRIKRTLAGVAASAGLGALVPSAHVGLSGVSAASGVGLFAPKVTAFLTSVMATGALGELDPPGGIVVNLTGIAAAGALGSMRPRVTVALAGLQATAATGVLRPRTRVGLSGVIASAIAGTFTVSIWPALTGIQATARLGSFAFDAPRPKLVSITFTNVGLAATTTITNVGVKATTTFIDLD